MKRRWFLVLIALNLAGIAALVFAYPHLMVSPGPLIQGHAALEANCFACHAPLRGAAPERCIKCHALPDIGLRTTKGLPIHRLTAKAAFHQQLMQQDCMACHGDHPGPRLAERSRKAFSHELLRAGTRERCESCHKAPADSLHRQVAGNCTQCHRQEAWKPATFDHDKLFLLDRDHKVACVTCHVNNDYRRYTCYGCHEHQPEKIRREHVKEGIRDFENCVACHRSASEKREGEGARGKRDRD